MSTSKNVAFVLRHSSFVLRHSSVLYCCVRAAENSHRQGPEVCPSRQARDFEAVTGLNDVSLRNGSQMGLRRNSAAHSSPPAVWLSINFSIVAKARRLAACAQQRR